jgi:chromosome partitioning protein
MIPGKSKHAKSPHVIVVGNEKGGSGKSTVAVHIAVALMKAGASVATVDIDAWQSTFTRYIENRRTWAERLDRDLGIPVHVCFEGNNDIAHADERLRRRTRLIETIANVAADCRYVVIDTPSHDSFLVRFVHSLADTLITPLNDSFVDLDVLAHVDAETFAVSSTSQYAQMVQDVRCQRQLIDRTAFDWIVLRNRISTLGMSRNKQSVGAALQELSQKLNFQLLDGFAERVIYREFFPRGLTAVDDIEEGLLGRRPTMSHMTARLEVQHLLSAILLGGRARLNDLDEGSRNVA